VIQSVSLQVVEVQERRYGREKEPAENEMGQRRLLTKGGFLFSFDHPMQGSCHPKHRHPTTQMGFADADTNKKKPTVGLLQQPKQKRKWITHMIWAMIRVINLP